MTISKETNICISELKEEDGFLVDVFPEPIRKIIRETKATLSGSADISGAFNLLNRPLNSIFAS